MKENKKSSQADACVPKTLDWRHDFLICIFIYLCLCLFDIIETHMIEQKLGTKRKEVANGASIRLITCATFERWDLRGSWQQE